MPPLHFSKSRRCEFRSRVQLTDSTGHHSLPDRVEEEAAPNVRVRPNILRRSVRAASGTDPFGPTQRGGEIKPSHRVSLVAAGRSWTGSRILW